jgi:hypothetical protein
VTSPLSAPFKLANNMSRHAAIVEEFDDDTDLPLPSRSLPDTGSRGAILEEIVDSDYDEGDSDEAPDLLDHSARGSPALPSSARDTRVTDITPYKKCANRSLICDQLIPCSYPTPGPHIGGRVFTQFISTRRDLMERVLEGYRDPRVCGGLLARTLRMPALA